MQGRQFSLTTDRIRTSLVKMNENIMESNYWRMRVVGRGFWVWKREPHWLKTQPQIFFDKILMLQHSLNLKKVYFKRYKPFNKNGKILSKYSLCTNSLCHSSSKFYTCASGVRWSAFAKCFFAFLISGS